MKHIHVVEPYNSAAMQRMTMPLLANGSLPNLYLVTSSKEVDPEADVNLHMPWHTLVGQERGTSKHVAMYTHCNPKDLGELLDACARADIVTAMSYQGRRELIGFGVDPAKIWVIYAGASDFLFRKRLLAVIGYSQPNGRKREHMLLDMAWEYDMSMYEFLFVGLGWDTIAKQLNSLGVGATAVHLEDWKTINAIYSRIDALLVTGYTEGGPLPLLEAMSTGAKVFSPRFGYASDLLEEDELYDNLPDLMDKMEAYFGRRVTNHLLARSWTWMDYAAEYALLLGRLLGESVDMFPERGMSRYAQLLDAIDEVKPQRICEIGTWNGHTAARLIQQAAKYHPIQSIHYQGFDLFGSQTGEDYRAELSKYGCTKSIVEKKLKATGAKIDLVEGYTRDTLFRSGKDDVDFFFIDGGHSEETIKADARVLYWMHDNAVAVFDDYYHAGAPAGMGCNKIIDELDRNQFEITHLPVRTIADDGREIGMVKVRRNANIRIPMPQATYTGSDTHILAGVGGYSS